jgi:RNA polymerase sigma factor (sigma-70 family)
MPDIIYLTPGCNHVSIFERFYCEWNPTLFKHVITKVPNYDYDLTCEICQQIWCEVWQGIRANTLPYLMPGLLVCKADSRIADHHRRTARLTQLDPAKHDRADRLNMDERIDHKTALAAIPDDERDIFILCFREGFTQEEVAAQLAVSTRTVRRKLDAALTHLQEFLQGETVAPGIIAA